MFSLIKHDLQHILKQIKIAERHAAGEDLSALVAGAAQGTAIATPQLLPLGLRTVTGEYNNLLPGQQMSGSSFQLMPRMLTTRFTNDQDGDRQSFGPGAPALTNTNYATVGNVVDADPRIISNLVADQSLGNKAAIIAALTVNGAADPSGSADTIHSAFLAVGAAASDADRAAAQNVLDGLIAQHQLTVERGSVIVLNVASDGASAPYNSFFTLFGQFFDHGLDMVSKGGSGKVYIPLQPDDPLYKAGSPTNFMVLTRATNQAGPDGVVGTADDVREHRNETTPFIDLNQVYTSHPSHQVFLREYVLVDGKPVDTGHLLEGSAGGPPTWADIKAQARDKLGIELNDFHVHSVPLLATDDYGQFIAGANGLPQLVMPGNPPVLVEGSLTAPVSAAGAMGAGAVFLADIAHTAAPAMVDHDRNPQTPMVATTADADTVTGNPLVPNGFGLMTQYDNELLDRHFIVGDGRGNENIGLTAVHTVFHSEHNHRVDQIKTVILESAAQGDLAFLNEWLLTPVSALPQDPAGLVWDGARLFQAARFSTEMVYQHLVFEQFARAISPTVDPFVFSNNPDVDPAIVAEFAHVVYRFGHSMLNETVDRIAIDGNTTDHIGLIEAFLNPVEFNNLRDANGVVQQVDAYTAAGAIIRGMSLQTGNEIDEFTTGALRNNLVGLPLDLGALNIARGRETGVPSLNEARRQFFEATQDATLKPYASWSEFAQFLKNPMSVVNFIAAYGTHESITSATTVAAKRDAAWSMVMGDGQAPADRVDFLNATGAFAGGSLGGLNDVDFWIGGLAERKIPFGGMLGTSFNHVFEVQMERLQAGDRFYYLSRTQGMNLLTQLEADSFGALVVRNSDLGNPNSTHVAANLFQTPDLILEVDTHRQRDYNGDAAGRDPLHADPLVAALNPLVQRSDGDGNLANGLENLRYTGDAHAVLGGTDARNILISGAGDDTAWGDGGDDDIEGGLGNDHLFGGAGNDIITDQGSDFGDVIEGGSGHDFISSGNGLDLLFGGEGQDFIFGSQDDKDISGGLDNDFIQGGTGSNVLKGNEGDDWIEGGDGSTGFDGLAGENSELFFNSRIIGHDILNGRGGDSDYDGESGDDIMVQSSGIQRNNGMAGFDWAIHKGDAAAAHSDLGIPIFANQQAIILRDRFDLVEGLSGWVHNDTLIGRSQVLGAAAPIGVAAVPDADSPYLSYSNSLTAEGVARIQGFDQLTDHLPRQALTVNGETHTVLVMDVNSVVRDAQGNVTTVLDTAGDVLLGGGGSDILNGMAGNDIIDGDRWLNVRISIRDPQGAEIGWADGMSAKVYSPTGQELHGGRSLSALMQDRTYHPGQLQMVRELLDGDVGNLDRDTVIYRGLRADYSFFRNEDGSITVQHNGRLANGETDGTDRLYNVEALRFAVNAGGTADVLFDEIQLETPPVLTAPAESAASILENTVGVVTRVPFVDFNTGAQVLRFNVAGEAVIEGASPMTLSLVGEDAALFSVDNQGNVSLRQALNFEAPVDFNRDGIYRVDVQAADGISTVTHALSVTAANVNEAPTGAVSITGTPFVNQVLRATHNLVDQDGNGTIGSMAWQWKADGVDIFGAVQSTLTVSPDLAGKQISVSGRYVDGGGFVETHLSAATGPVLAELLGTAAANTLNGTALNDIIRGLGGNDVLNGFDGHDLLDGGTGDDRMTGGNGNDIYVVDSTRDVIVEAAAGGFDTIRTAMATYTLGINVEQLEYIGTANFTGTGSLRDDVIIGGSGSDILRGQAGNDDLRGGVGSDQLTGGAGADRLTGGEGADVFIYAASTESGLTTATRDLILDFVRGVDRINLSAIDASASATGNQAFVWRGTQALTAVGQLNMVYDAAANQTLIQGNTSGTVAPELVIALAGDYTQGANLLQVSAAATSDIVL